MDRGNIFCSHFKITGSESGSKADGDQSLAMRDI